MDRSFINEHSLKGKNTHNISISHVHCDTQFVLFQYFEIVVMDNGGLYSVHMTVNSDSVFFTINVEKSNVEWVMYMLTGERQEPKTPRSS